MAPPFPAAAHSPSTPAFINASPVPRTLAPPTRTSPIPASAPTGRPRSLPRRRFAPASQAPRTPPHAQVQQAQAKSQPPMPLRSSPTASPAASLPACAPSTTTPPGARVPAIVRDSGTNVVVVGGGPVGCLTASLLSARGVHVTLLDPALPFSQQHSSSFSASSASVADAADASAASLFNPHRSYALGLFPRGLQALSHVPGLHDYVIPSFASPLKYFRIIKPTGSVKRAQAPSEYQLSYFSRFRLVDTLRSFVLQRTDVNVWAGATLTDVSFEDDSGSDGDDGQRYVRLTVKVKTEVQHEGGGGTGQFKEEERVIRSRLVIACDGRRSTVVECLRKHDEQLGTVRSSPDGNGEHVSSDHAHVHSKAGFEVRERMSKTSGAMSIKSLILSRTAFNTLGELVNSGSGGDSSSQATTTPNTDELFSNHITVVEGQIPDKTSNDTGALSKKFNLGLFPTEPRDVAHLGGMLGVTTLPTDHPLWSLTADADVKADVDRAYVAFEHNFPQVSDVRRLIARDQMEGFLRQRATPFPSVGRPASLTATIGREAGVVLLGDSAHWFPPDCGQGVNAGLEDAIVFMHTLNALGELEHPNNSSDAGAASATKTRVTLADITAQYDRWRDYDTDALLTIAEVAAPYQYRQSRWRHFLSLINILLRKKLSSALPGVFNPAIISDLAATRPYGTVLERANDTTRRLMMAASAITVLLAAAAVAAVGGGASGGGVAGLP